MLTPQTNQTAPFHSQFHPISIRTTGETSCFMTSSLLALLPQHPLVGGALQRPFLAPPQGKSRDTHVMAHIWNTAICWPTVDRISSQGKVNFQVSKKSEIKYGKHGRTHECINLKTRRCQAWYFSTPDGARHFVWKRGALFTNWQNGSCAIYNCTFLYQWLKVLQFGYLEMTWYDIRVTWDEPWQGQEPTRHLKIIFLVRSHARYLLAPSIIPFASFRCSEVHLRISAVVVM